MTQIPGPWHWNLHPVTFSALMQAKNVLLEAMDGIPVLEELRIPFHVQFYAENTALWESLSTHPWWCVRHARDCPSAFHHCPVSTLH